MQTTTTRRMAQSTHLRAAPPIYAKAKTPVPPPLFHPSAQYPAVPTRRPRSRTRARTSSSSGAWWGGRALLSAGGSSRYASMGLWLAMSSRQRSCRSLTPGTGSQTQQGPRTLSDSNSSEISSAAWMSGTGGAIHRRTAGNRPNRALPRKFHARTTPQLGQAGPCRRARRSSGLRRRPSHTRKRPFADGQSMPGSSHPSRRLRRPHRCKASYSWSLPGNPRRTSVPRRALPSQSTRPRRAPEATASPSPRPKPKQSSTSYTVSSGAPPLGGSRPARVGTGPMPHREHLRQQDWASWPRGRAPAPGFVSWSTSPYCIDCSKPYPPRIPSRSRRRACPTPTSRARGRNPRTHLREPCSTADARPSSVAKPTSSRRAQRRRPVRR